MVGWISIQPTIFHSHFSCTQGVTECCPLSLGEGYSVHPVAINVPFKKPLSTLPLPFFTTVTKAKTKWINLNILRKLK